MIGQVHQGQLIKPVQQPGSTLQPGFSFSYKIARPVKLQGINHQRLKKHLFPSKLPCSQEKNSLPGSLKLLTGSTHPRVNHVNPG